MERVSCLSLVSCPISQGEFENMSTFIDSNLYFNSILEIFLT